MMSFLSCSKNAEVTPAKSSIECNTMSQIEHNGDGSTCKQCSDCDHQSNNSSERNNIEGTTCLVIFCMECNKTACLNHKCGINVFCINCKNNPPTDPR